jgi:hypothetical protein
MGSLEKESMYRMVKEKPLQGIGSPMSLQGLSLFRFTLLVQAKFISMGLHFLLRHPRGCVAWPVASILNMDP